MRKYEKAPTDWMAGAIGLSVHWTSKTKPLLGKAKDYQDAVGDFDLDTFVGQLKESGVRHLIFTTTHGQQYWAGPHPVLDYLLPGRTSKRDLLGEMAERLRKEGVRLIFYYNHACNGDSDLEWKEASRYTDGPHELFAGHIMGVVEYASRRYGELLSGWWFDSPYSLDPRGPHNSITTDIGDWRFPWEALTAAAKSGNPECVVSYNSGIDLNFLYTGHQDYMAGETTSLQYQPSGRWNDGLQLHQWGCIDNLDWVHCKPDTPFTGLLHSNDALCEYASRIARAGGAATFNVEIAQDGRMNPLAIKQLRHVTEMLGNPAGEA